ncbi:MAG TPA: hypothetical protein VGG10_14060 [Rhizomicrobium sp.]|jgi:hypothetical protein
MSSSSQAAKHGAMCEALVARGPAPEVTNDNDLFGWLVGSWDVEVHDFESDGARRVSNGEWHFAWVLEGRAIQDVFVTPRREERSLRTMPANRYGTTLRIFDAATKTWRLVWIDPVSNDIDVLSTRRDERDIVQEGKTSDGASFRWIFSNIEDDGFVFTAETADETGSNWKRLAELTATRKR